MQISELAEQLGVAPSALRYYERIGLVPSPSRTASGYRSYDDDAVARVQFVVRAKRLGLTLDEVGELLPIWDGVNCGATHERVAVLVDAKRAELRARIDELERFAAQLDAVGVALLENPPPAACLPDLSCCMPANGDATRIELGMPTRR